MAVSLHLVVTIASHCPPFLYMYSLISGRRRDGYRPVFGIVGRAGGDQPVEDGQSVQ